jgi:iron-sulfur cluster insertion protein
MNMTMTESAVKRVITLREKKNNPNLMLRITVLGGGCSGFQYAIELDEKNNADDVQFEQNGAVLVTDETSLPFLNGAEVDFISSMMKSEFKIHNPNAAAGCGCGASFAVKQ